ncbi:hypothetical protein PPERSA_03068 [Pseudocohnilembus persalinus]|uniref:Uncharacterized protein n=1 Tax=Pseudocohnilembus persalinus TaxID=266149 RepID=A0A0V0R985_PSEPJ|nr:hypothetical protein PPERSA_03068 [Pseudocohnilembus persalinus]|eukprot:KRX11010.1 hypothetical protein PPERSA_03068 [Pseudocohnilembus persalinus]
MNVLKKKSEKLNFVEIAKFFCNKIGLRNFINENRIDNLQGMKELDQCVFVQYNDDKNEQMTVRNLVKLFIEGPQRLQIIQENIKNHSRAQEIYYVEYRHDDNTMPIGWKFFKKAQKDLFQVYCGPEWGNQFCGSEVTLYLISCQCLPNVKNIKEQDRTISKKLYKQMIVEKCQGDFCNYQMMEKKTGPLAIRKNIFNQYEKHFGAKQEDLGNIAIDLPYEINNQLIMKVRTRSDEVCELLIKNRIFQKTSKQMNYQNEEHVYIDDINEEYPFRLKDVKFDKKKQENLYKRQKICKSCFIIYSLASKYFDEELTKKIKTETLQREMHKRQWSAPALDKGDKSFLKFGKQQFSEKKAMTAQSGLRETNYLTKNSANEDQNVLPQLKNLNGSNLNLNKDNISIKNTSQQENQKEFFGKSGASLQNRNILIKKSGKRQNSLNSFKKTNKDINANRMTLGFMNYEKVGEIYSEDVLSQKNTVNYQNKMEKNSPLLKVQRQFSIMDSNDEILAKKKQLSANTQLVLQINEEKKNLRKKVKNDHEYRQQRHIIVQQGLQNQGKARHLQTQSMFYNNPQFLQVRQIPKYVSESPLQPLVDECYQTIKNEIDLEKVCSIMNYPKPPVKTNKMNYLIIDSQTAIPYMLVQYNQQYDTQSSKSQNTKNQDEINEDNNEKSQDDFNKENYSENSKNLNEKQNEVVIFAQDFFDSFLEYVEIFKYISRQFPTKKFVLLNFPGQSYTLFSEDKIYDNLKQSQVIDRLLYHLEETKQIDLQTESLSFIGYGYGGFILQSFLTQSYNNLPNIGEIQLINSFYDLDKGFKNNLINSLDTFQNNCPDSMPELPFSFHSIFVNSIQLEEEVIKSKMEINPIKVQGRVAILKGILESIPMGDRFQRIPIKVQIVHTLKNSYININESDKLSIYTKNDDINSKNNSHANRIKQETRNISRTKQYIDGGHSLIEENINGLLLLVKNFVSQIEQYV